MSAGVGGGGVTPFHHPFFLFKRVANGLTKIEKEKNSRHFDCPRFRNYPSPSLNGYYLLLCQLYTLNINTMECTVFKQNVILDFTMGNNIFSYSGKIKTVVLKC